MFVATSPWLCWTLLSVSLVGFTCADQETITAESGQDVTLTCRAPINNGDIVEWSRADLRDTFVFVLINKTPNEDDQNPSYKHRVDLQDKEMKDGDVSVILKNVTAADNGTYECCIVMVGTCPPICSISLRVVDPPGNTGGDTEDGSVGLKVGLPFAVIVAAAVVVVLIYRNRNPLMQDSSQPPVELQPV
ncbi:cell surface A33 antigen-like isoform X2 [Oreochromis aureus]|uniref:cell surface A33 antigen-like isoform X2 n=1 Tax=Oreochromis aureus TaxID=47969 RepID=UPI0019543264|nr:cell surface A33 antigen-like isoform X2 [Oreochromis aureus]